MAMTSAEKVAAFRARKRAAAQVMAEGAAPELPVRLIGADVSDVSREARALMEDLHNRRRIGNLERSVLKAALDALDALGAA